MTELSNFDLIRLTEQNMRQVMSNTQRCDRELAESAVKKLYALSGHQPPKAFVWVQSPLDGVPAAMLCAWIESGRQQINSEQIVAKNALISSEAMIDPVTPLTVPEESLYPTTPRWRSWLGNLDLNEDSICYVRTILQNNDNRRHHPMYADEIERINRAAAVIRTSVERATQRYISHQLKQKTASEFFAESFDLLSNATANSSFSGELNRASTILNGLTERNQSFVRECLQTFMFLSIDTLNQGLLKFRYGQHDADHACQLLFAKWIGDDHCQHADQVMEVTRTCGWWCPFASVCIMIDRPVQMHLDQRGMLHNTQGPSCLYEDGLGLFSLRGIAVPQWIAEGQFDLAKIFEVTNAEWRRVMIDRYGIERYLQESNANLISQDRFGRLFRISLGQGQDPLMMIEVINSTPEQDGTYKKYFLRVPPTMLTAQQAVAWTFSMENDYNPIIES